MSEQESLDIGKIVGLIMENPQLIEQISGLMKQKEEPPPVEETAIDTANTPVEEKITPTYASVTHQRGNRARLLGALKPYVSEERARAIDSMISIADILDMMKAR